MPRRAAVVLAALLLAALAPPPVAGAAGETPHTEAVRPHATAAGPRTRDEPSEDHAVLIGMGLGLVVVGVVLVGYLGGRRSA
jgi:hypothetical protein